ncbi:hypothetical protein Taro_013142 [Colocasia esculenta]|uniref:Uncharacterized protein n=1 Tax=Colocasia esculenta TaxID=4460 RepID=A0A843UF38_COLES|nr:hypothetical protein [Colocasia esculenta]
MLELVGPDGKVVEEERGASCVVDRIACCRDNLTRMTIEVRVPTYVAGATRMVGETQLVPPWLEPLLATPFFSTCVTHSDVPHGECNMFCLDCPVTAAFCFYYRSVRNLDHRTIQVGLLLLCSTSPNSHIVMWYLVSMSASFGAWTPLVHP